jgi:hypothetical protein
VESAPAGISPSSRQRPAPQTGAQEASPTAAAGTPDLAAAATANAAESNIVAGTLLIRFRGFLIAPNGHTLSWHQAVVNSKHGDIGSPTQSRVKDPRMRWVSVS